MLGLQFSARQLCEYDAREFLTDDVWKKYKLHYDECMAFRKSLKGKPTPEQLIQIKENAVWISFYDQVLWHSTRQAQVKLCVCPRCDQVRKAGKPN